ncbi:MAG: amidohydrolase family protein [Arenimonas sp.]|nr:amidohydrolase family protein [Arenimonas sp.]
MRRVTSLILLSLASAGVFAAPSEEHFTVVTGGNKVGHVIATHDGNRVTIDFDVKNNGRGPTIAETLTLDERGLPTQWTITGATTFGSKVEERFALAGDKATWKDSLGDGGARVTEPSLYIGQAASPWSLGLYARALLADADGALPALPGGTVRVTPGETLSVTDGKQAITVRVYAISGLEYAPDYVLLDQDKAMFAVISPGNVVVRKGFEGEQVRLRAMAANLSTQRLEEIQKLTAHRYGAPVRFRNVRVFDPKTLALSAPVSVVINGRHISSIQPLDSAASPGEVLVEGEGGTLVAGLHEMHAHTGQEGALLNIAAGVTTVRDMGNDNAVLDALIQRIEAGTIGGPRVHRSGFIEGKSPFNSNNGILVNSEAEALAAVRWYAARGYGQVKLYNSMRPEWSAAAAKEAHRLGLRVAGHVPAFTNADAMVDAGYDELTHINQIALGWVLAPEEDTRTLLRLTALKRLATLDLQSARVQRTLDHIVANKVAVEPTIAIHENLLLNRGGAVPSGAVDYIDNLPVGEQRGARAGWADMSAPGDAEAYAAAYAKILDTLRQMRARGVLLIPGTDLGGSFTFHREMELFAQLGYTPAEVLKLATWDMAAYLGQDQATGSIERGKLADFFLVAGDPTADLKAIKAIRAVVKDGAVYYPSEVYPHFGIKPFATAPKVTLPAE